MVLRETVDAVDEAGDEGVGRDVGGRNDGRPSQVDACLWCRIIDERRFVGGGRCPRSHNSDDRRVTGGRLSGRDGLIGGVDRVRR